MHQQSEIAYLADYIRQARYGDQSGQSTAKIFGTGLLFRPPTLRKGQTNRILLYPGSFNPPHLGHLNILCHAFNNSGRDLNIIAAIVVCRHDSGLRSKFDNSSGTLILSQKDRIKLWNGNQGLNDWFWTYNGSPYDWSDFRRTLTDAITKDGFKISWSLLIGGDYADPDRPYTGARWECEDFIFSNIGRQDGFTRPDGSGLLRLREYSPWEKVSQGQEEYAENIQNWIVSRLLVMGPKEALTILNKEPDYIEKKLEVLLPIAHAKTYHISVCTCSRDSRLTTRFIPKIGESVHTSSTEVRAILFSNCPRKKMIANLRQVVPYPELLLEIVNKSKPAAAAEPARKKRKRDH